MNAHAVLSSAAPSPRGDASIVLNNEILLYGIVDAWEVRALDLIAALAELRHLDTITVRINSPGGSVYEGLAIYDALRMSGRRVVVRVDALAGSIASIIAMAGDEIVMAEDARLMIHNPWSYAQGESEDLRKLADELDSIRDRLIAIYRRKATTLTRAQLIAFMDAETFFSAQEAVELGFCDRIDVPLKAAALAPDAIRNRKIDYFLAPASTKNPASSSNAAQAANSGTTMTLNQSTGTAPQNGSGPVSNEAMQAAARAVAEIYNACTPLGEDAHTRAQDMVARGLSPDQARAEVINLLVDRQPSPQRQHIVIGGPSPHDRRVFADALYATISGRRLEGPAAQYAGMSPMDIGAARLQTLGVRVPTSRDQLFDVLMGSSRGFMNAGIPGMHTTSDFPILLQDAGNRVLLDGYQAAQSAFKALARRRNAVDFRALSSVRLSDPSPLEEVPESGEITHSTRTEEGESFALKTFAKLFAISRQALINDDLGAFADTLRAFGRSAAETEARLLAGLFTANGGNGVKLSDGVNLFDASRGNKASTGAALNIESLGAARAAMRLTKGPDGDTVLGLAPAFLVVGPELETQAEQILAEINAAKASDANPFAGKLELLIEPRINDKSWRLFASTATAPILSIAYLNGNEGPILEAKDGWNVLGTEFRAILDFGCGVTDWRGAYLNPGQ
jgi:ATP-dependent Clp endopeptidase proteolytic subunit ClpP